jgi:hypothetical protein
MMLPIEPLSQGDRENFQLLLFRLTSTQARVNFCSPRISLGERKNHEHHAGIFQSPDYGNLSELQG